MRDPSTGANVAQALMAVLLAASVYIAWRERRGKPVSPAFRAFFTVGGRRGSYFWTAILVLWAVGGWGPLLMFSGARWLAPLYLAGLVLFSGKAMGFWRPNGKNS